MNKITFPDKFVVTGTDTGLGKTVISAILTLGLEGTYWKPIQAGTEPSTDTEWVRSVTGLGNKHFCKEKFCFSQAQSPHLASVLDNTPISLDSLQLPEQKSSSPLIIEGCGGLMVPLNDKDFVIDMFRQWKLPTILVARSTLGTINHTLLSIDKLRQYDIPILGVVLNGPHHPFNRHAIEKYGQVPVLAEIPTMNPLTKEALQKAFLNHFM